MGDRPRDEQDPFEDLDAFFAPLEEDADWPGGEVPPGEPAPPPGDAAQGEGDDALAELDELEIDLPEEDDLLAEPAAAEAAPDAPGAPDEEPSEEAAEEPALGEAAPSDLDLETGEMAGEEWDRLRAEAMSQAPEGEEAEAPPDPSLTVDDLRAAPPQYSDLPGAAGDGDDEPSGPVLEDPVSGTGADTDEGVFGPEESGVEVVEPPAAAGEAPDEEEAGQEPASVEAAAEHFATGMRPEEVERELLSDLGEGESPATVRIEPPEPAAPEEPVREEGARAVATEEAPPAEGPPGGRNVTAAMVSGILLGAAVLALLAIGKGPFTVLVLLAVLLAQAELYAVMRTRGFQPATLLGLACGGVTLVGAYLQGEGALLLGPALAMGLSVPWYMVLSQPARKNVVANIGATMFGVMYVPFLASFALLILRIPGDAGRNLFLIVLAVTVLYDVCAYAVGTLWGNRPLAPTISPHKSWEGAIGATFAVLLIGLSIVPNISPFDQVGAGPAVGLALVLSIVAPLGDLVESAIKRDLGVKDMGSLLPGHGGMLDRIDAVLFALPASYFFLRIVLGG